MKITNVEVIEKYCKMTQPEVLYHMSKLLRDNGYKNITVTKDYVLGEGNTPVCVLAHADTVFPKPPTHIFFDSNNNVMWSPNGLGADDRAGIYAISRLVSKKNKPHVIITTNEEMGAIGANALVGAHPNDPFKNTKFLIQLDRRGLEDSVYYSLYHPEFEKFINSYGFTTAFGTFTDISVIAPAWGLAAVNLSIGYINEHSEIEHLFITPLYNTIKKVSKIIDDVATSPNIPKYEYIAGDTYPNYAFSCVCDCCGKSMTQQEVIDITAYDTATPLTICYQCFDKYLDDLAVCDTCHEMYLLHDYEKETEQFFNLKSNHWLCKYCREDEFVFD